MTNILAGKPVPRIGLGCMGMSEFYGATDDKQSLALLMQAYEVGYRHFDTADMYGYGHNEKLLNGFLKDLGTRREQIVLASKGGIIRDTENKYEISVNSSKKHIKYACEQSLRRLGVEHIDLYYMHRLDSKTSLEEAMGAVSELKAEGKIGAVGLCEVDAKTLRQAHALHPITALQSEYSLWSREIENEVLEACKALGVAVVAFSPLGRGFLTGKIDREYMDTASADLDLRAHLPRFNGENLDSNLKLISQLEALSQQTGIQPANIALAWVLHQGDNIYAIPGTKKEKYLIENFSAANIQLSAEVQARLHSIFAPQSVAGTRYPHKSVSK